jgi:hypothetical protein
LSKRHAVGRSHIALEVPTTQRRSTTKQCRYHNLLLVTRVAAVTCDDTFEVLTWSRPNKWLQSMDTGALTSTSTSTPGSPPQGSNVAAMSPANQVPMLNLPRHMQWAANFTFERALRER